MYLKQKQIHMKLSIIIPVHNEEKTIGDLLKIVSNVGYGITYEIIVVDDGSTDNTLKILKNIKKQINFKIISYKNNRGKGYASRIGLKHATGEIVIFQDADLEYNPHQIQGVINPIIKGEAKVVYGSRFKGRIHKMSFTQLVGNKFLTLATNLLFGCNLSDMECCYTAIHKDALKSIKLTVDGFEVQAELTGKLLRNGFVIKEVPGDYQGRTREEGKKIKVIDGIKNLIMLLKVKFNLV